MRVPDWWTTLLLIGAGFRVWRLLAKDTITEPLRDRVFRLEEYNSGNPKLYRHKLDEFVNCPWCFGFWVVVAWWAAWQVFPHAALVVAVPFAVSAAVGLVAGSE